MYEPLIGVVLVAVESSSTVCYSMRLRLKFWAPPCSCKFFMASAVRGACNYGRRPRESRSYINPQESVNEDEVVGGSQLDVTYCREEFSSVQDWSYCKRKVDPDWVNETKVEGPETKEAEARLRRRLRHRECIANATYQCGCGCL